jgi:subtilisin family serine protease
MIERRTTKMKRTVKQFKLSIILSTPLLLIAILLLNSVALYAQSGEEADALPQRVLIPLVMGAGEMLDVDMGDDLSDPGATLIPNQYIVVLKDDLVSGAAVEAVASEMASEYGSDLLYTYADALSGFTIRLPEVAAAAIHDIAADERVAYVEQDSIVTLAEESAIDTTQTGATWGIDRIDQRNLPLNGTYNYANTGAGVRVYIIDTGIRISHNEFGGRALDGYDAIDSLPAADCNGHGTHVAGTVGGNTYGVAKGVTLYAVRVLNCSGSGTNSGVIAGVNWVTGQKNANPTAPFVANMSLGGSTSTSLDNAVKNSIAAGVSYAIAGGNSNRNACNYSPARVANAITVGATSSSDSRASYSNYGSCLDIFAPGSSITSAWYSGNDATAILSGTSMASPHVAGVAALYLQGNPSATPATVRNALVDNATTGVVKSPGSNSPNRLLFANY